MYQFIFFGPLLINQLIRSWDDIGAYFEKSKNEFESCQLNTGLHLKIWVQNWPTSQRARIWKPKKINAKYVMHILSIVLQLWTWNLKLEKTSPFGSWFLVLCSFQEIRTVNKFWVIFDLRFKAFFSPPKRHLHDFSFHFIPTHAHMPTSFKISS